MGLSTNSNTLFETTRILNENSEKKKKSKGGVRTKLEYMISTCLFSTYMPRYTAAGIFLWSWTIFVWSVPQFSHWLYVKTTSPCNLHIQQKALKKKLLKIRNNRHIASSRWSSWNYFELLSSSWFIKKGNDHFGHIMRRWYPKHGSTELDLVFSPNME